MSFIASSLITGAGAIGGSLIGGAYGSKAGKKDRQLRREQLQFDRERFGKEFQQRQAEFDKTHGLQRQQLSDAEQRQAALQKAYHDTRAKGGEIAGAGEGAFMSSLATPSAQLEQQEKDIQAGTAKGMQQASSQMQANLAQQGVRGGQAATQMRRGIGEMGIAGQEEINKLRFQDEQKRATQMRAYQSAKAQRGYGSQLGTATF